MHVFHFYFYNDHLQPLTLVTGRFEPLQLNYYSLQLHNLVNIYAQWFSGYPVGILSVLSLCLGMKISIGVLVRLVD